MMNDCRSVRTRLMNKYCLFLCELDAQVAQAETVMKGYLAELGYE